MTNRSQQKLIQVGNARAVVVPRAWRDQHPDCRKVTVVYDDVILIFPEDQAARVDQLFEQLIAQVVRETVMKEAPSHGTAGTPQPAR